MKKKEFLTEAKRKVIIADKEKVIIESFAKTFNKIKRIDENEINGFEEENPLYSRQQEYGINPEIEPEDLNIEESGVHADNDEEIKLFQFSSNFLDIVNGVEKTKNDLKHFAGATFGGASEKFYNSLSIALNDFYKNIYKPIEAKYIEDMRQQDKARRRLYPQEYEK